MSSLPRIEWVSVARLALCSAMLGLACSKVPQDTGEAPHHPRIASKALLATASGRWRLTGPLAAARHEHTATLLPSGKVLVAGGGDGRDSLASAEVYDPDTGAWSPTNSLASARSNYTATLLPSGKVLVAGGWDSSGPLASAEVYDPDTGQWSPTNPLASARYGHTATLLPSGKVLVTGDGGSSDLLYDPDTGSWSPTGPLASPRSWHTATLLRSGKVLVAGGIASSGYLSSAEVYDPATGSWSPTGPLVSARFSHTATLLPSGKVLVAGGWDSGGLLASAEMYDPDTGTWSPTSPLASARFSHTATLLPSGQVLVAGGWNFSDDLDSAEVYDPDTGSWSPTGPLASARSRHTATLLPSGKVLVAGGDGSTGSLASAEVYEPDTGSWSPTGPLSSARFSHTATLLPSGKVLVAGGNGSTGYLAGAEVYDPDTGTRSSASPLASARAWHTATLLPSGKVLVAGGVGPDGSLASVEIYDPATGSWSLTGALASARAWHTATLLPSGKVLVAGGIDSSGYLSSAEVYDPDTGAWSPTSPMASSRQWHTATLLPSGKVLVAGGNGSGAASAEVYDPDTGSWSPTDPLASPRYSHTATLLPSGKVLVAGGDGFSGDLGSAVVYDPATGSWNPTSPLVSPRESHTATLLPSGKVLVAGGWNLSGDLDSAEVYDPATGSWSPTGPLASARSRHTATLLPSGKVLLSGGSAFNESLATAEVYDDTGALLEWRPLITPPGTQRPGELFPLTGSGFRGLSEASGGATNSSASDVPLVRLVALEGGALTRVSPLLSFSDTHVTVRTPWVPNGFYILSVVTNAIHGGQLVRVDGPSPAVPEITSPPAFVNSSTPAIRGAARPGSTISVWLDGNATESTRANAQGQWSLPSTTALAEGPHRLKARAMDAAGNFSPVSEEYLFTVDTVPPPTPVVTSPGEFVNSSRPTIRGTAEAASLVTVSVGEAAPEPVATDDTGAWSLILATALSDEDYQLTATATDAAGNTSPASKERVFTVDTTPPAAPVVISPKGSIDTHTPIIRGTVEPGSKVKLWLGGDEANAQDVIVDPTGDWRFTPPAALDFGNHTVSAIAEDNAVNRSEPSLLQFSIQKSHYGWSCTTAPSVPAGWALLLLALSLGRRHQARPEDARAASRGRASLAWCHGAGCGPCPESPRPRFPLRRCRWARSWAAGAWWAGPAEAPMEPSTGRCRRTRNSHRRWHSSWPWCRATRASRVRRTSLVIYVVAWAAPEPIFSKAFAASVTLVLTLTFTVAELTHVGLVAYHLATVANEKSTARAGPWTPVFETLFMQAGLSMEDVANKVTLLGHFGPHPEEYHAEIFRRLRSALEDCGTQQVCRSKLVEALRAIADEVCTPGSKLHQLLTRP